MKVFAQSLALALAACSSTTATPPPAEPSISISAPSNGATVTAGTDADKSVPLTFAVVDFTLKAPGTCAGAANCGHIHVLVDGAGCTPAGQPYDNAATSSPAVAKLASCPKVAGSHTASLELHNDDHSPVNGATGSVIAAQVTFTAQ
jgi:hypothetical protein